MSTRHKQSRTPYVLLTVVAVVALGVWAAARAGVFGSRDDVSVEGVEVKRGPLDITVVERGNLRAAEVVSLKNEVEGTTTILYLIPEGTHVEAGTLLCELDAADLIEKSFQQKIAVRNADAAFVKASQNYEIQLSQNQSDIAEAEQALVFADQDLEKYEEGEKLLQLKKSEQSIKLAEEDFKRAVQQFDWSTKLAEKGYLTATELQADELAQKRAEIMLDQAKQEDELLTKFQVKRDLDTLVAGLEESRRELERVKLQADARLVDFKADKETSEAKLDLETEKLAKIERQIQKAKLFAPRSGMVVYAKQDEGGRYGNSQPIAEGTSVRERQEIITIPNAGGMIAQASLHESVLKMVEIGMAVKVDIGALPGQAFHGTVSTVAVLPDQNSWWANPNLRLYKADIKIEDPSPEMRPGMSSSIEIQVERIPDTLFVPVQCIFRHKGASVAFIVDGSGWRITPVKTGKYNDKWVQVLEGLAEGERVLLALPAGLSPDPGDADPAQTPEGDQPEGAPAGVMPTGLPTGDLPVHPQGTPAAALEGERPSGGPGGEGGRTWSRGEGGGRPDREGRTGRPGGDGGSDSSRRRPGDAGGERTAESTDAQKRGGEGASKSDGSPGGGSSK